MSKAIGILKLRTLEKGEPVKEVIIKFPAIATKTYQAFKSQTDMLKIMNDVIKKMKKLSSPARRARLAHKEVNNKISELFENSEVKAKVSCREGCSACCHTQVSITDDEAQLLYKLIQNGHQIDLDKLKRQSVASREASSWYKLSYQDRGCIFLDEKKSCSIYDNRPLVCRTNHVVSDPSDCSTEDGAEKPVNLLNTFEADMVLMGAFSQCEENGAMPDLLFNLIEGKRDLLDMMSPRISPAQVFKEF